MRSLIHPKQSAVPLFVLLGTICSAALGQELGVPSDAMVMEPTATVPETVSADDPSGSDYVSIQVDGGTITQVLNAFAIQTGRNVVIGPDVISEGVSIHLNNVRWDEALEVILKPYGFGYRKVGDTIVISKLEKLAALEAVEPLQTKVFQLQFVDAADVKEMLESQLSARGSMSIMVARGQKGWEFASQGRNYGRSASSLTKRSRVEEGETEKQAKSKTIVVTDIPGVLNKIEEVLAEIDSKPQQILVESRFLEVNENFLRDVGVEFFTEFDIGGNPVGFEDSFFLVEPNAFNPATTSISGGPPNMGGVFSFSSDSVEALLSLLQEDDDSKILSAPRVLTLNNQEATIIVGEKYPIIESDVSGTVGNAITSTTLDYYENIGIQLNVVPQISGDGYINMIVHPSVSSIADFETGVVSSGGGSQALTQYPRIKVREAETQILLRDSETIVIGGLLEEREGTTVLKVPFLGDIPILGHLFRRTTDDKSTVDLLIFLSASIVDIDAPLASILPPPEKPEVILDEMEADAEAAMEESAPVVEEPEDVPDGVIMMEVPAEEVPEAEVIMEVPEEEPVEVDMMMEAPAEEIEDADAEVMIETPVVEEVPEVVAMEVAEEVPAVEEAPAPAAEVEAPVETNKPTRTVEQIIAELS